MYKCTSQKNTITIPGTVVSLFVVKGTSIRRAQSRTGSSLFKMGPVLLQFLFKWNQGGHNIKLEIKVDATATCFKIE